MLVTDAAAQPGPAREAEAAAAGGVVFRDTVSQPVPVQRPGRRYQPDDFAPGARSRSEPRPVAPPATGASGYRGLPPAPTANGVNSHAAGGHNGRPSDGTANHSTERTPQPAAPQREHVPPAPEAESKPAVKAPRGKPPKPGPPPFKRPRDPEPAPASQPAVAAPKLSPPAPAPPAAPPAGTADGAAPGQGVWRSAQALAQCLACDICCEVLVNPVTAPTCMHCYCRDCIDTFLVPGGTSNCCPVCQCASVSTSLGQNPYKDHLKMDFVLESLIRKVFPDLEEDAARMAARHVKRAALDAALASQRTATQVAGQPASLPKRLRMDGVDVVELFVSGPAELELEQPYLRVHRSMAASTLARFLRDRLREAGYAAEKVVLTCGGARVEADEHLGDVLDKRWRACAACGQLLTIEYQLERAAAQ